MGGIVVFRLSRERPEAGAVDVCATHPGGKDDGVLGDVPVHTDKVAPAGGRSGRGHEGAGERGHRWGSAVRLGEGPIISPCGEEPKGAPELQQRLNRIPGQRRARDIIARASAPNASALHDGRACD